MWNTPTLHEIQYELDRDRMERRLARLHPRPAPPQRPGGLRQCLASRLVSWGLRLDPEGAALAFSSRPATARR